MTAATSATPDERDYKDADEFISLARKRPALRARIRRAREELVAAYRDWNEDRDSKVGKRISNAVAYLDGQLEDGEAQ